MHQKLKGKYDRKLLLTKISELWNSLTDEDKDPYQKAAQVVSYQFSE